MITRQEFQKQVLENYKAHLEKLNSKELRIHINDQHGKEHDISDAEIRETKRKIAELEEILK